MPPRAHEGSEGVPHGERGHGRSSGRTAVVEAGEERLARQAPASGRPAVAAPTGVVQKHPPASRQRPQIRRFRGSCLLSFVVGGVEGAIIATDSRRLSSEAGFGRPDRRNAVLSSRGNTSRWDPRNTLGHPRCCGCCRCCRCQLETSTGAMVDRRLCSPFLCGQGRVSRVLIARPGSRVSRLAVGLSRPAGCLHASGIPKPTTHRRNSVRRVETRSHDPFNASKHSSGQSIVREIFIVAIRFAYPEMDQSEFLFSSSFRGKIRSLPSLTHFPLWLLPSITDRPTCDDRVISFVAGSKTPCLNHPLSSDSPCRTRFVEQRGLLWISVRHFEPHDYAA